MAVRIGLADRNAVSLAEVEEDEQGRPRIHICCQVWCENPGPDTVTVAAVQISSGDNAQVRIRPTRAKVLVSPSDPWEVVCGDSKKPATIHLLLDGEKLPELLQVLRQTEGREAKCKLIRSADLRFEFTDQPRAGKAETVS